MSIDEKTVRKRSLQKHGNDFKTVLGKLFPGAIEFKQYLQKLSKSLEKHGFTKKNTIPMVSVCRDEITRPFVDELDSVFRDSFDCTSLAGFVFCGKTGLSAGMAHAPQEEGVERYLFFCGPHIAISADGEVGGVYREGRAKMSHACGALLAFQEELESGIVSMDDDTQDVEQVLIKHHLIKYIKYGEVPSLQTLTYKAHDCIFDLVNDTLKASLKENGKDTAHYAVCSYILVHGPNNSHYVWVGNANAVVNSQKIDLKKTLQQ